MKFHLEEFLSDHNAGFLIGKPKPLKACNHTIKVIANENKKLHIKNCLLRRHLHDLHDYLTAAGLVDEKVKILLQALSEIDDYPLSTSYVIKRRA